MFHTSRSFPVPVPTSVNDWKERLRSTSRLDERIIYIRDYAPELVNTSVWDECVLGISSEQLFYYRGLAKALLENWPEIIQEQLDRRLRLFREAVKQQFAAS